MIEQGEINVVPKREQPSRFKKAFVASVATFGAGAAMLMVACGGSENPQTNMQDNGSLAVFTAVSETPTVTQVVTPKATEVPKIVSEPKPYDGPVGKLKIPGLKVDAAVENIALDAKGNLDTPQNPHNVGWYGVYDRPGEKGNAVFAAHVDYYEWKNERGVIERGILGPFHDITKMKIGDEIDVVMDNNLEYKYKVIKTKRYKEEELTEDILLWPKDKPKDREWITLVTCGGDFVASRPGGPGEYTSRDVLIAERVN
ncbi:class F sortase [Candidatus Curtissbacteria bacterium]|nr:class F sortase [Candidatus Curtissbacteria bacterium]